MDLCSPVRKLMPKTALATLFITSVFAAGLAFTPVIVSSARADAISNSFSPARAGSNTADHKIWDGLLQSYVKADKTGLNRVDYKAFKANGHGQLKSYLKAMQKVKVATLSRDAQFAFWANLYNAVTIDVILSHYPVASIKKIKFGSFFASGPWGKKLIVIGGQNLSLDSIEHKILRGLFKDPRVHYAVNCASIGCPNLANRAFTGATLNAMLDAGARAYINHPRGASVKNGRVQLSSIYKWFKADFGSRDPKVLDHIRAYAAPTLKAKLNGLTSIGSYTYDWTLNDIK